MMRVPIRISFAGIVVAMMLVAGCLPASRRTSGSGTGNSNVPLATDEGNASYYADNLEGHPTASGEPYHASDLTAAHRTYPFGTLMRVVNTKNGRDVIVRVNDRGPFKATRIIDLSRRAAEELMMVGDGVAHVRIEVVKWGA
jgi:rare lipoprotein A